MKSDIIIIGGGAAGSFAAITAARMGRTVTLFEKNEKMVGRTFRVMVDGFLPEENIYVGRTYGDAPEVDGCIFFECVSELVSGTIVPVQITDAKGYDLMGVIVSERRDEE